ncbi:homeobox-leucine zipper protein HAT4-like [Andrographis paniculata]|uniref:homeobox-leucine zipper protein HAT4-like n=1 Tax=Andrographis paniculata TaxID=175694 RepID=UPI0021E85157|nr:homeobox-leucine zipper protein HAT4-like [Andrographis paniculata]
MADRDVELGLSLSLRMPENNKTQNPPPSASAPAVATAASQFPLNFFRSPMPYLQQLNSKSSTADAFKATADRNAETRSVFRGIDVNRAIPLIDVDEEAMVSSPNSTVSSLSGKRSEREENDGERASSSLEIDDDGDAAARKKLRLSKEQAAVLEETFKEQNTLNPKQKMALARQLNLRPRQVEVWFQNRRARTKLKQTEVDCEYLRRCCENLTEENRRLQKEVSELRALKMSPQFYMNMSPPTTLTMCPQCERVAVSSSSTATAAAVNGGRQSSSHLHLHHHQQRPAGVPANSWAAVDPLRPARS